MEGKSTTKTCLGNSIEIIAISEWRGAERMDTEISVTAGQLCYIGGNEYHKFITEFQKLINKYRI